MTNEFLFCHVCYIADTPRNKSCVLLENLMQTPDKMLYTWISEFMKVVEGNQVKFIALHCQEIGGKDYVMENVNNFVRGLTTHIAMSSFTTCRIYIDEDFETASKFTALGNFYFVHKDIEDAEIWNFKECKYVHCTGSEIYVGNIEGVTTKEKAKFPQEFFPEFPSLYTLNRRRALEHTLDRFHNDKYETVPIFLFGDFNFRLDTCGVVQKLTGECTQENSEIGNSKEKSKEFKGKNNETVLTVSRKHFGHSDHETIFLKGDSLWLREFDKEFQHFAGHLFEFPVHFPPTYPFEEGPGEDGSIYMQTRCPSWCDRVLFSSSAKELINESIGSIKYGMIGLSTRMGDHKPVYLSAEVLNGEGIIRCCHPKRPCSNFVHELDAMCFTDAGWCNCQAYLACSKLQKTVPSVHGRNVNGACIDVISEHVVGLPEKCLSCISSSVKNNSSLCKCSSALATKTSVQSQEFMRKILNNTLENSTVVSHRPLAESVSEALKLKSDINSDSIHQQSSIKSVDSKYSQSEKITPTLRLKDSSTRMFSHHSSSSEEWFEEVPAEFSDKLFVIGDDGVSDVFTASQSCSCFVKPAIEFDSAGSDTASFIGGQFQNLPPSMNNLLLSDSCDHLSTAHYYLSEGSSVSGIMYSEDNLSNISRPTKDSETLSQAPTCKIDDEASQQTKTSHKNSQSGSVYRYRSLKNCCVVI